MCLNSKTIFLRVWAPTLAQKNLACPKIPSHVFFSAIAAFYPLLKQSDGGRQNRRDLETKCTKLIGENVDRGKS